MTIEETHIAREIRYGFRNEDGTLTPEGVAHYDEMNARAQEISDHHEEHSPGHRY